MPLLLCSRLLKLVQVLVGVTLLAYVLTLGVRDPVAAMLGEYSSPELRAEITAKLGLDRPLLLGYLGWLGGAVTGDLGVSIRSGQPVQQLILERIGPSLQLTSLTIVISVVGGIGLGLLAAAFAGRWPDWVVGFATIGGLAIPNFWLSLLLVLLFTFALGWLPPSGYRSPFVDPAASFRLMILPVTALSLEMIAVIARLTRAATLESLSMPFAVAARARGLSDTRILFRYAARVALIPVFTFVGLRIGYIVGGAVIVETIFKIPGIGSLTARAVYDTDYPVLLGLVLVTGIVVCVSNLCVDLLYRVIDPRTRL